MRRKGFSLIELLVVIAVITILTAILLPVFTKAREKARQTDCISNLRQLGLAVRQYAEDWEAFPLAVDGFLQYQPVVQSLTGMPGARFHVWDTIEPAHIDNFVSWMDLVYPYSKNMAIFVCPSTVNRRYASYGYNIAFGGWGKHYYGRSGGGPANVTFGKPTVDQDIRRPSDSVMLVDCNHPYSTFCNAYECWLYGGRTHNDGFNVAFADGHTKWAAWNDSKLMAGADSFETSLYNPYWNIFLD